MSGILVQWGDSAEVDGHMSTELGGKSPLFMDSWDITLKVMTFPWLKDSYSLHLLTNPAEQISLASTASPIS